MEPAVTHDENEGIELVKDDRKQQPQKTETNNQQTNQNNEQFTFDLSELSSMLQLYGDSTQPQTQAVLAVSQHNNKISYTTTIKTINKKSTADLIHREFILLFTVFI